MDTENKQPTVLNETTVLNENAKSDDTTNSVIALLIHDTTKDSYIFPRICRLDSQEVKNILPSQRVPSGVTQSHQQYAEDMATDLLNNQNGRGCYTDISTKRLGEYRVPTESGTENTDVYVVDVSVVNDHGELVPVDQSALQSSLYSMMLSDRTISYESPVFHDGLYILACGLYYARYRLQSASELIRRVIIDEIDRREKLNDELLNGDLNDVMVTLKVLDDRGARASSILWKYAPDTMMSTLARICTDQESSIIRQKIIDQIPVFIHEAVTLGETPRKIDYSSITVDEAALVVASRIVELMLMDIHDLHTEHLIAYKNWTGYLNYLIHTVKHDKYNQSGNDQGTLDANTVVMNDRASHLSSLGLIDE
jgi:hypothetical protein